MQDQQAANAQRGLSQPHLRALRASRRPRAVLFQAKMPATSARAATRIWIAFRKGNLIWTTAGQVESGARSHDLEAPAMPQHHRESRYCARKYQELRPHLAAGTAVCENEERKAFGKEEH